MPFFEILDLISLLPNWLNWFLDLLIDCSTCRFTRIANWICTWTWSLPSDQTNNNNLIGNLEWIYCLLTICNLLLKNKKFSKIWYFRGISYVQMPQTAKLMSNSWSATSKTPGYKFFQKSKIFEKIRRRIRVGT